MTITPSVVALSEYALGHTRTLTVPDADQLARYLLTDYTITRKETPVPAPQTTAPKPGDTATHDRITANLGVISNHVLREEAAEAVRDAFYVMERGRPVLFADVRPGDLIRATREQGGTVHTREHRVAVAEAGVLRGEVGEYGTTLTIKSDGWSLYLLHRPEPEPAPLADLKPGRVADKDGGVWMYDGERAYGFTSTSVSLATGGSPDKIRRPWRQLDTLTPVSEPLR